MQATKTEINCLDRLKKRSDFLWTQKKGRKWVAKAFVLQATPNDGHGRRYGITVTKRVSKKAVDRNRMKRRLRAIAGDILPFYCIDNTDLVFVARMDTMTRPYVDLKKDLIWCLKKLELYDKNDFEGRH